MHCRQIAAYILAGLMAAAFPAYAEDISLESLYINPEGKKLPEAIIFYSSDNPCENCRKAIDMTVAVLRRYYQKKLHAYLINTADHPEYVSTFKLHTPVSLVVIRISDGASFGYGVLGGLESKTSDTSYFSRLITEFINNFLGY